MFKPPFPYYGGKSPVAAEVWRRLGDVSNYVEPFCGGCAVLLNRPAAHAGHHETVNDSWCFLTNFWRAVKHAPQEVARWSDSPVNQIDLESRHGWLLARCADLEKKLLADPEWYDARAAGWWAWGQSLWVERGWCVPLKSGRAGRTRPSLDGRGLARTGKGGVLVRTRRAKAEELERYLGLLADRLRRVRVLHGDWKRALTSAVTTRYGLTGVFLDPPYTRRSGRDMGLYARDSGTVGYEAHRWAVAHGDDPQFRIALCGYEGEYEIPPGWGSFAWKSGGRSVNRGRERIWFSPHCLP